MEKILDEKNFTFLFDILYDKDQKDQIEQKIKLIRLRSKLFLAYLSSNENKKFK